MRIREDFWDFVSDLILLAEDKKFGKSIYQWIEKKKLKSKDDLIDLDEEMADRFGMSEEKAGKIIAIFVKHKAGAFDEKECIRKIDTVK